MYSGSDQTAADTADESDTTGAYPRWQNGTSFNPAGEVECRGGPYHRPVDEVKVDSTVTRGGSGTSRSPISSLWTIWSPNYDPNPDEPGTNRIFMTWVDGFGTTTNGSMVGNVEAPFAELSTVHGGRRSMPYSCSNNRMISEATMTLTARSDWTEQGVSKLSL